MHQTLMCSAHLIYLTLCTFIDWNNDQGTHSNSQCGSYLPCRLFLSCYKSLTLPLAELLSWQGWVTSRLTWHHMSHNTRGARARTSYPGQCPQATEEPGPRLWLTRPQHNNNNSSRWYNESTALADILFWPTHREYWSSYWPHHRPSHRQCMNVNFSDLTSVNCSYSIWICVCIVLD